ncbi:hypothetical protein Lal_00035466 [Lupinus albus]|nr:hypothetical protein Lal_00035466 [Lupinus albus]
MGAFIAIFMPPKSSSTPSSTHSTMEDTSNVAVLTKLASLEQQLFERQDLMQASMEARLENALTGLVKKLSNISFSNNQFPQRLPTHGSQPQPPASMYRPGYFQPTTSSTIYGSNPEDWLFQEEQYFNLYQVTMTTIALTTIVIQNINANTSAKVELQDTSNSTFHNLHPRKYKEKKTMCDMDIGLDGKITSLTRKAGIFIRYTYSPPSRCVRNQGNEGSSSSTGHNPTFGLDPFYAPTLQVERLAKFVSCKPTYARYSDMEWMVDQGFNFTHDLEVQGVVKLLELNGSTYPSLVREFYANFQYKDGGYQRRLILMNDEIFLAVGGLASDGAPLGNCDDEK